MAYKSFENPPKTLVITSRVPIVHQWKETFEEKFEISFPIDYLCIQSAYKIEAEYDLVIIDEVHRSLSPEYRKVFQNIKTKHLICLTATLPEEEEYRDYLSVVCPVVYSKTLAEVVDNKIIPEFSILNLEVPLSPSAGGKYKIFDSQFHEGTILLTALRSKNELYKYKYASIFDMAKAGVTSDDKDLKAASKKYWGAMQMRKNIVYSNPSKLITARHIVDYIGAERK